MSSKTADELISASVGIFSNNLTHLDAGVTQQDQWELEQQILLASNLLGAVKRAYQSRLIAAQQGRFPFGPKEQVLHRQLLDTLADVFTELEERVQVMERVRDQHVAHSHELFTAGLELQSLLKQQWVPVAPVSVAFEEVEVGAGNEAFLARFLPPAR